MPEARHLSRLFEEGCARTPENVVLMTTCKDGFTEVTFRQLQAEVEAWAEVLRSRGVKAGDRVAAIANKSQNHFRFFYACWRLGAVAVPVCESLGNEEMAFVLSDCKPALVLTEKAFLEKATQCACGLPVLDWAELPVGMASGAAKPAELPFGSEDEALDSNAVFIYTSGSTGLPKGVVLTHRNIWWNMWSALEAFKVDQSDRLMSLLPYWHAYALTCEICCTFQSNFRVCVPKDKKDFVVNIAKYQPTVALVVPRIIDMMMAAFRKKINALQPRKKALVENAIHNASRIFTAGTKWNGGIFRMLYHYCFYNPLVFRGFRQALGGRIKMFVSGGAPLDLDAQSFFSFCGMPILQGYGLTESAPVISSNMIHDYRLGSCGKLMRWLEPQFGGDYTFQDEEGNRGKDLRGELLVKGVCVMKGYWGHKDASAKTVEADGWLHTGDIAHMDKDGFLFLHGRNSSMIVLYGGEKVHPEAVEDAVKSSPLISEAMVIGEKCKSLYVCANVTKEAAAEYEGRDEELHKRLLDEIKEHTAGLAAYERPKDILVLPEFSTDDGTMTATLKVRRFKIKELYRAQIEKFLADNGEDNATKKEFTVQNSRILESLEEGSIVVGVDNEVKKQ